MRTLGQELAGGQELEPDVVGGGRRSRWFGIGLNLAPFFLLCMSCQAQSASSSHLFLPVPSPISLVSSQVPLPTAPLISRQCFLQLLLPLIPTLAGASISMKQFPLSHFLGKSSSTRRAGCLLPTQVPGAGAKGVAAAGSRGPAWGWVSVHVQLPRAAGRAGFARSWRDSDGKSKMLPGPKITFLTDLKALFQNI